jgi:PDZ domain-containing protein
VLTRLLKALTPLRLATAGVFVLALAFVVFLTRGSDEYLEIPDEAHPLAGLVSVEDGKRQRDGGGIYYVDVIIKRASFIETLIPALRPDGADLIDRRQLVTPGISDRERLELELADMKLSQVIASTVALRALGYDIRVRLGGVRIVAVTSDSHAVGVLRKDDVIVAAEGKPVRRREDLQSILARHRVGGVVRIGIRRGSKRRTFRIRTTSDEREPRRPIIGVLPAQALNVRFPFRIRFNLGEVGGPSAGLAFALELLEKRGRDVDQGYKVAATGQIQLDGTVTRIGGVKQKTIGARQADVDVFLVPVDGDNARVAKRYANGLRIIPVESFQQALRALATLPQKD